MSRRRFLVMFSGLLGLLPFLRPNLVEFAMAADEKIEPVVKSDAEWEKELPPESYEVLRHEGTEAPFTGRAFSTFFPAMSRPRPTASCLCSAPNIIVRAAAGIRGMYSTMDRSRRACAIATMAWR
jgi:hypothetical protein